MRIKKPGKRQERYIPLSDIEKINDAFLSEMERVKTRLGYVKDEAVIQTFHEVLLTAYSAAIEIQTREREVDYDIKLAEIEQRRRILKPWRRCRLWRLLFQPLTNRAQDIIEERAELDADIIHTAAEKAIGNARKKFETDNGEKLSKRELKRLMRDELNAVIEKADNADVNEAFAEPPDVPAVQENAEPAEPAQGQQQEQLRLDVLPPAQTRRPRPPRSCRRPPATP